MLLKYYNCAVKNLNEHCARMLVTDVIQTEDSLVMNPKIHNKLNDLKAILNTLQASNVDDIIKTNRAIKLFTTPNHAYYVAAEKDGELWYVGVFNHQHSSLKKAISKKFTSYCDDQKLDVWSIVYKTKEESAIKRILSLNEEEDPTPIFKSSLKIVTETDKKVIHG